MMDREKVIVELTDSIEILSDFDTQEYTFRERQQLHGSVIAAIQDALALLKAQEPRVMTLEEVKSMKRYTICAVEQRSKLKLNVFNAEYRGCFAIDQRHMLDFGLYMDVNPFRRSEGGYGKTWRCWTSRPTDKQREATPWQGQSS